MSEKNEELKTQTINNAHHITHTTHYPHNPSAICNNSPNHICTKESEITRLEEKVKTLFEEHKKLNSTLANLNETQMKLLTQITNLSSIINTLKWTLTIMIAIFGGLFVFIISEVIKIIH